MKYKEYLNGNIKIYNCDCLELIKSLENYSIDLCLTDPPYNQSFIGSGSLSKKYSYRRESILKLSNFQPLEFLNILFPKLKTFNAYIWTSKNLLPDYLNWANEKKLKWDNLVWIKNNPIPAYNNSYLSDIEYCIFMRASKATWNNGLGYNFYRKALIENVANNMQGHPTQKYLWMIERQLLISSKENDIIFDGFMGSGTTAIACIKNNRKFIGCEIDEKYFDIACERIEQELSQLDFFR